MKVWQTLKAAAAALVVAVSSLFVAAPAFAVATPVDVTDTVANIAAQLTPIGLVATAVLGIFVAIKAYKWVRRALS